MLLSTALYWSMLYTSFQLQPWVRYLLIPKSHLRVWYVTYSKRVRSTIQGISEREKESEDITVNALLTE